jgi:hypothetical protein
MYTFQYDHNVHFSCDSQFSVAIKLQYNEYVRTCITFLLWFTSQHCISNYTASNSRVTGELTGKDLEGSSHGLIKVISLHLPGRNEEKYKKLQSR